MWILIPGGLLMPALTPEAYNPNTKHPADPSLTEDGRFELQVRARVESHLTNFIRDYMIPMGLPYSALEFTPKLDYNVRFYTTREAFSQAMARAVLDIDYKNYKIQAERRNPDGSLKYKDGKAFHDVLVSAWSLFFRLGAPGGKYTGWGNYSSSQASRYHGIGSTFSEPLMAFDDLDDDWTPVGYDERQETLDMLDRDGIALADWRDYLTEDEWLLVKDEHAKRTQPVSWFAPLSRAQKRNARRSAKRRARLGG